MLIKGHFSGFDTSYIQTSIFNNYTVPTIIINIISPHQNTANNII